MSAFNCSSSDNIINIIDMTGTKHEIPLSPNSDFTILENTIKTVLGLENNKINKYDIDFYLENPDNKIDKSEIPNPEIEYFILVNVINKIPRIFKSGDYINLRVLKELDIREECKTAYHDYRSNIYDDSVNYITENDKKFHIAVNGKNGIIWITYELKEEWELKDTVRNFYVNSSLYGGIKLRYQRFDRSYDLLDSQNNVFGGEFSNNYVKYTTDNGRYLLTFWNGNIFEGQPENITVYDADIENPRNINRFSVEVQQDGHKFVHWNSFDVVDDNHLIFYQLDGDKIVCSAIVNTETFEMKFSNDIRKGQLYYDEIKDKYFFGDNPEMSNKKFSSFFRANENTIIFVNHKNNKLCVLQI